MSSIHPPDDELADWDEIKGNFEQSALLLGNGASIAIAPSFNYKSLFEKAKSQILQNPLSTSDIEVFERLRTSDFEQVLSALSIAKLVCQQVGHDESPIVDRYEGIRRALLESVRSVHPKYSDLKASYLKCLQQVLKLFKLVFTTNYDLLVYWAVVQPEDIGRFVDFFWDPENLRFNLSDTDIWYDQIPVHYLHGALFIHELPDGTTVKARGEDRPGSSWGTYTPLLELNFNYQGSEFPLFVTEGDSAQKKWTISSSSYLSFVYKQFAEHEGPLVVYGHSLAQQDEHLLEAVRAWIKRAGKFRRVRIAISIYTQDPDQILIEEQRFGKALDGADVTLFDARTFPLAACITKDA